MCQTKNVKPKIIETQLIVLVVYLDISVFPFSIDMLYILLVTPLVKQTSFNSMS